MPEELAKVLATVEILLINEGEARMLSKQGNLKKAAAIIQKLGPRVVVIKRGEHGATLFGPESIFTVPAFPLDEVSIPRARATLLRADSWAIWLAPVTCRMPTCAAPRSMGRSWEVLRWKNSEWAAFCV